jgi:hypothetical protein
MAALRIPICREVGGMGAAGLNGGRERGQEFEGSMKHAIRKKQYCSPAMELLTYDRALAKVESEERWTSAAERLPMIGLEALLLTFPALVVLSVIEPSRILMQKVLLAPSPLVWIAWALVCLWAGLSSEKVVRIISPKARLRGDRQTVLLLLGLGNCISVVSLLWLAGG